MIDADGDWVFSEIGRTYPTAEDFRRGITGGCTVHMQMMWVPRNATYCFWLGKAGETRPEGTSNHSAKLYPNPLYPNVNKETYDRERA